MARGGGRRRRSEAECRDEAIDDAIGALLAPVVDDEPHVDDHWQLGHRRRCSMRLDRLTFG